MQNKTITIGAILLAGSFLLAPPFASLTSAAENGRKFLYDQETGKTYGPKAPVVWEKPTKVNFIHEVHTKDAGLSCESCHNDIFTMKSGTVLADGKMTMDAMAKGQFCGVCHDGSTAFATNSKCTACHTDSKGLTPPDPIIWSKPVKAVIFYHQTHTEKAGLSCEDCHDELFAMKKGEAEKNDDFTMKSLYEGKYCGKCHDGSTAFASDTRCNACHIGLKGYERMTGASSSHGDKHKAPKAGH